MSSNAFQLIAKMREDSLKRLSLLLKKQWVTSSLRFILNNEFDNYQRLACFGGSEKAHLPSISKRAKCNLQCNLQSILHPSSATNSDKNRLKRHSEPHRSTGLANRYSPSESAEDNLIARSCLASPREASLLHATRTLLSRVPHASSLLAHHYITRSQQ